MYQILGDFSEMLTFLLLYLTGWVALNGAAYSLPSSLVNNPGQSPQPSPLNRTEYGQSLVADSSAASSYLVLNTLPIANRSAVEMIALPSAFDCRLQQDPTVSIDQNSTYMTILKAMIALSTKDFTSPYDGGVFVFQSYYDVGIVVWPVQAPTAPLEYRHVIYGLYEAIQAISMQGAWFDTIVTLFWTGDSGVKAPVGYVKINRRPSPSLSPSPAIASTTQIHSTAGQDPSTVLQSADLTSTTSSSDESTTTDNSHQISIIPMFRGTTLSLPQIFLTLITTILAISNKLATAKLTPFSCKDITTNLHLEYKPVRPVRTAPPYLTYQNAAKALALVPKAMFQQNTFRELGFMVKVDGTEVGGGFLERDSTMSSSLVGIQTS